MNRPASALPEFPTGSTAPEGPSRHAWGGAHLSAMPIAEKSVAPSAPRTLEVPAFPTNPEHSPFSDSSHLMSSLSAMPVGREDHGPDLAREVAAYMEAADHPTATPDPVPSNRRMPVNPLPPTSSPFRKDERPRPRSTGPAAPTEAEELREAFFPFVEEAVQEALYGPQDSLQTYLEPMLRQTVRRAIAEQMETAHLFEDASGIDRLVWHLKALVSSKTYDEIVFDHTKRYQVEEVYLFSEDLKWLISYASHDPGRHGSPRKVQSTVRILRSRLSALRDEEYSAFDLPEGRLGLLREGKHTVLVAVMRGRSNAIVRADLDYLQYQIEERYGRELRDPDNIFLQTLQPILEAGLLIQAPPASQ